MMVYFPATGGLLVPVVCCSGVAVVLDLRWVLFGRVSCGWCYGGSLFILCLLFLLPVLCCGSVGFWFPGSVVFGWLWVSGFCCLGFMAACVSFVVRRVALLAKRWIKQPEDLGVFIQGAFRSNYGIIGLAVSYNLFSDSGLAQASLLLALVIPLFNVLSIIALTLPAKHQGGASIGSTVLEIVKNPLIIAVFLALPFSYFGFQLPEIAQKTGRYFANLTLPLALLAIGGSLNMKSLRSTSSQATWATLSKLLFIPVILTLAAWAYGFKGQDLTMLMVLFGCPTAAASFVMAKAMGGNEKLAANIILMTTIGSILSLSAGIYIMRVTGVI